MAGSDEAPEKAQKRAEYHSHLPGGRQHKRSQTPWEDTIGRRDSDQATNRLISERLRRQHWCAGRHACKLGTRSPAAVGGGQGAPCPAREETQFGGGDLPSATAKVTQGAGTSRPQHHDCRRKAGGSWADPSRRHQSDLSSSACPRLIGPM